jgi:hypothetical protein
VKRYIPSDGLLDGGAPYTKEELELMNWPSTLDAFTRAYLICALWSTTGDNDRPLDADFDISDLGEEARKQAVDDCKKFQTENAELLARYRDDIIIRHGEYSADDYAGHDFWLTRCGHGCGFWDRDYRTDGTIGGRLTEACKAFGGLDIYVGDDGKLYFSR